MTERTYIVHHLLQKHFINSNIIKGHDFTTLKVEVTFKLNLTIFDLLLVLIHYQKINL